GVVAADPVEQLARLRVAGDDRRAARVRLDRARRVVEPQLRAPLRLVAPVALEAAVGEERPDVAVVADERRLGAGRRDGGAAVARRTGGGGGHGGRDRGDGRGGRAATAHPRRPRSRRLHSRSSRGGPEGRPSYDRGVSATLSRSGGNTRPRRLRRVLLWL